MLALVLVQALDLDVEERVWRHVDAALGLDDGGKVHLVGALDRHELLLESGVVRLLFQPAQPVEIGHPIMVAEGFRDRGGQARVALQQPAARRDAVGLVLEFSRIERVELREEVLLQQRGVQRGHAVDRVRAGDGEVRHAHMPASVLLDDRADALLLVVAGPLRFDELEQARVDLENDLEMSRQHLVEEADVPFLEGLGHERVVGVGENLADNLPGGVEGHVLLVDKDTRELDHRDRGMRVVELDHDLVGEVRPRVGRVAEVAADDVAQ